MRYLVLSDIHANLQALDAVLADEPARQTTHVLVLGDLVGYGANPNEVVDRVRALSPVAMVRGNHDRVAAGLDDPEDFNPVAQAAALWTAGALTRETREFLRTLPVGPLEVDDLVEICHGSPIDEDLYIVGERQAVRSLDATIRPLCLFGHTHLPLMVVTEAGRHRMIGKGARLAGVHALVEGVRYLVNPGSVGQPRDGDPRAAYATVDTERRELHLHRVAYPVAEAQEQILAAGLPVLLAHRLSTGQ